MEQEEDGRFLKTAIFFFIKNFFYALFFDVATNATPTMAMMPPA